MTGLAVAQRAAEPAPIEQRDATLNVASEYIGRALFLRCFCSENNLTFDTQGRTVGVVKAEDWTLGAVNVTKVERKGPGEVELDGVRVAIRYAADRHEFERHPQNDEKMRIAIADTGDPKQMERALAAVFSTGIDLPLQRSMPEYWRHYFDPSLAWPNDELSGQTIYVIGSAVEKSGVAFSPPSVAHRTEAGYTAFAQRDHVKGTVQLRLVVDAQGVGRRIAIAQPLGYGLDEKAVEAMAKFRFAPAAKGGSAVASMVLLDEEYVPVAVPR
jgi:TonB family protein